MNPQFRFQGLLPRAIAAGSSTPDPGGPTIIWSTTEGGPIYWTGSVWSLFGGSGPNMNDVFRCDWFMPSVVSLDVFDDTALTIDFTHPSLNDEDETGMDPVVGQVVYVQPDSSQDITTEGVYVLGSVADPSAVPITRHSSWPASRPIYQGTEFLCARGPRYPAGGIDEPISASEVNVAGDTIQSGYLHLEAAQLVQLASLDSGAIMPGGLSLGFYRVHDVVYVPDAGEYGQFCRAQLRALGSGSPVNITSTGSNGSSSYIFLVVPKVSLALTSPCRLTVRGTDDASHVVVWGTQAQLGVLEIVTLGSYTPDGPVFGVGIGLYAVAGIGASAVGDYSRAVFGDAVAVGNEAYAKNATAIGSYSMAEFRGLALGLFSSACADSVSMLGAQVKNSRQVSIGYWDLPTVNARSGYSFALFHGTTTSATEAALDGGSHRGGSDFYVRPGTSFVFEGVAQAASNAGVASWSVRGLYVRQISGNAAVQAAFTPIARSSAYAGVTLRLDVDPTTEHLKAFVTGITDTIDWTVSLMGSVLDSHGSGEREYAINHGLVSPPGCAILQASASLAGGRLVNIWDDSGTAKIRYADASSQFPADGFIMEDVASGTVTAVHLLGENMMLSGMTVGRQYLGEDGQVTATVPTANLHQEVGFAISTSKLVFQRGLPINL
jgi:hypothetical protein